MVAAATGDRSRSAPVENLVGSVRLPMIAGLKTSLLDLLHIRLYFYAMKATLTSKGQITIPLVVRKSLRLKAGDVLNFDENASILTARRVIDPAARNRAWEEF